MRISFYLPVLRHYSGTLYSHIICTVIRVSPIVGHVCVCHRTVPVPSLDLIKYFARLRSGPITVTIIVCALYTHLTGIFEKRSEAGV